MHQSSQPIIFLDGCLADKYVYCVPAVFDPVPPGMTVAGGLVFALDQILLLSNFSISVVAKTIKWLKK